MNEAVVLAQAVRLLKVTDQTKTQAISIIEEFGKNKDLYTKLYSEWLNDIIIFYGEPLFQEVSHSPNTHFITWIKERLLNPYHVTFRAHDKVRAQWGDEIAFEIYQVRWDQEVAWAKRMRLSDNDRIAFLAGIWLAAAERDSYTRFQQIASTYIEALDEPSYRESSFHLLSAREILEGANDEKHWTPLWLKNAEREFGTKVNALPKGKIASSAQKAREDQDKDQNRAARIAQVERLKKWRPSLMLATLTTAFSLGLSSDDVSMAEKLFIADVQSGKLNLLVNPAPAWRVFQEYLEKFQEVSEPPDREQKAFRLEEINGLLPNWSSNLPQYFIDIGANEQKNLLGWFSSIAAGKRMVPCDSAIDYGMWLIENINAYQR